jgi:hypothetical protein
LITVPICPDPLRLEQGTGFKTFGHAAERFAELFPISGNHFELNAATLAF